MPVATLCAAASSGSARVPEPAIDSSTHVVSFVTLETRAIKDFEPAAAKTFPHGTKYRPTPDREAFNHKTLRLQIQPARYPQMRPQHHVQPLTNPPGHAQEPHERYRCKTTTKPTAATHQPPATETALEGAQEPSKTLGLGASARCTSSMGQTQKKPSKPKTHNHKQRPKRRNENVIEFWTPFWGIWTQKWGQPSENFAAARTCCASRFATLQLEHECQLMPFSLCASQVRLLLYDPRNFFPSSLPFRASTVWVLIIELRNRNNL